MGFVRQSKTYRLTFEDPEFEGLEVRARSVPVGTLVELIGLASVVERGTGSLTADETKAVGQLFAGFGKALVSWNLEEPILDDDGEPTGEVRPVPATVEGLYSQDLEFVMQIISAWMEAVGGVAAPLGQRSADGAPSLEASLPMEPSSPSPTS
jgi:hypothetical protein